MWQIVRKVLRRDKGLGDEGGDAHGDGSSLQESSGLEDEAEQFLSYAVLGRDSTKVAQGPPRIYSGPGVCAELLCWIPCFSDLLICSVKLLTTRRVTNPHSPGRLRTYFLYSQTQLSWLNWRNHSNGLLYTAKGSRVGPGLRWISGLRAHVVLGWPAGFVWELSSQSLSRRSVACQ